MLHGRESLLILTHCIQCSPISSPWNRTFTFIVSPQLHYIIACCNTWLGDIMISPLFYNTYYRINTNIYDLCKVPVEWYCCVGITCYDCLWTLHKITCRSTKNSHFAVTKWKWWLVVYHKICKILNDRVHLRTISNICGRVWRSG